MKEIKGYLLQKLKMIGQPVLMTFLPKKIIIFKIGEIFENSEKDGNCDIDITAPMNLGTTDMHGKAINKR